MAANGVGAAYIISGIIGAAAVVLVAYLREFLSKRTKRQKLRRALYAELQATNTLSAAEDMLNTASGSYFYTKHDFIPTNVYQSNLADIGLLSEDEIESVVNYYTNATIAKEEREGCEKIDNDDEASLEQRMSAADTFKHTLSYLQDARFEALESLEPHINTSTDGEEDPEVANEGENPAEPRNKDSPTLLSALFEVFHLLTHPWRKVWNRSSAVESVAAFILIPFVLFSVEASVNSQAWALPISAESIFTPEILPLAFTSSYVHAGPRYLWGNVLGYILIMTAVFPLAVLAGRKRELLGISMFHLLIVPFIVSWSSLILPGNASASGFSGVNAAFLGTLIVYLFVAWKLYNGDVSSIWSLAPGLLSLATAFAFAPIVSPRLPLLIEYIAGFGILGMILVIIFFRRIGVEPLLSYSPYRNSVLFWGVLIGVTGFLALFVNVSPTTNVLAHLTGFYVGFSLPFALEAGRELNTPIIEKTRELRKGF